MAVSTCLLNHLQLPPFLIALFLAWDTSNEMIIIYQRGRIAAKDFLPPSGDSPLLPPGAEDAFRGCQQREPGYTLSVPGLGLLSSCYFCIFC